MLYNHNLKDIISKKKRDKFVKIQKKKKNIDRKASIHEFLPYQIMHIISKKNCLI